MIRTAKDTSGMKGELPPGWRWVRLGEVCELNPRRPSLGRADNAPTTFVPMPAVDDRDGIIAKPEVRPYREVKKGYTYFAEGDVLFAKITPCMQNGKHAIAQGLIDGIGFGSTEFHVIRPSSGICSAWIHSFIRQPYVLHNATAHFTGAVGQQRVPESYLADLEIPLPPLAEQKRIAAILNEQMVTVERARAAAQAELDAAKALSSAYLREVFPEPGQQLPESWRWVKLGEVCIGNGQYGLSIKADPAPPGTPLLRMGNISDGKIVWDDLKYVSLPKDEERAYLLQNGDLLFNRTNSAELVGKSAVFDGSRKAVFASYLIRFRLLPDKSDPYFLCRYVNSSGGRVFIQQNMGRAIGQVNISASTMKNMPIPMPPLAEQKRIAAILNEQIAAAEKLQAELEAQLNEINSLPASLLRRAFAGEL